MRTAFLIAAIIIGGLVVALFRAGTQPALVELPETGHITSAETVLASRHEITRENWIACSRAGRCDTLRWQSPFYPLLTLTGLEVRNRPVSEVSVAQIADFNVWLSERADVSCRLPTVAEWVWFGRAGATTEFHFGDTANWRNGDFAPDMPCYPADGSVPCDLEPGVHRSENYGFGVRSVGRYPSNAWGLYDIHGSVSELTSTCRSSAMNGELSRIETGCELYASMGGSNGGYPASARFSHVASLAGEPEGRYGLGFRPICLR